MSVNEVAPDVYRISTYVPEINLQFNQLLVGDVAPLTESDVVGPSRAGLVADMGGPLAGAYP